jgi:hypothetical protein
MKVRKTLLACIIFFIQVLASNCQLINCKAQLDGDGAGIPTPSIGSEDYSSSAWWFAAANGKLHRFWNRHRHRLSRMPATPELAYRMMVMATMSYWEFHKRALPSNTTGFTLRPPLQTTGRASGTSGRKRRFMRKHIRRTKRSLSALLQKGILFPPLHMDSFRRSQSNASSKEDENNHHRDDKDRLTFVYWLFDWYETGVAKARFHDTDVLIAYGPYDDSLVISFGGTSSAADALTNIQTFEPANHSSFYHGEGGHRGATGIRSRVKAYFTGGTFDNSTLIQGSLHRGSLNAYARVDRGSVLRLCQKGECKDDDQQGLPGFLSILHEPFGNCTLDLPKTAEQRNWTSIKTQSQGSSVEEESDSGDSDDQLQQSCSDKNCPSMTVRPRRKGDGCYAKGKKLSTILQELTTAALQQGRTVHLTGHSLGGGVASHLALDLVINFPHIPVNKLHLWTFGAPQICDALFLTSAVSAVPRLGPFVENPDSSISVVGRLHRYVTLSDACEVDAVSEVAKRTLPAHEPKGIRRLLARSLGGVHDHIVHVVEPHYLLTPQQEFRMMSQQQQQYSATTISSPGRNKTKANDVDGHSSSVHPTTTTKGIKDTSTTPRDDATSEQMRTITAAKTRNATKGGGEKHQQSTLSTTTSTSHTTTTTHSGVTTTTATATTSRGSTSSSTTHSAVAAHACVNYLLGTSRESRNHPLQTDLPLSVREWLGEDVVLVATSS